MLALCRVDRHSLLDSANNLANLIAETMEFVLY